MFLFADSVSEKAVAFDATLIALVSTFGGALLTVVAGGIGAIVASRREHKKWLRDQRSSAYVRCLDSLKAIGASRREVDKLGSALAESTVPSVVEYNLRKMDELEDRLRVVQKELRFNLAEGEVLFPQSVHDAISAWEAADAKEDDSARSAAESAIHREMRKSLKIS